MSRRRKQARQQRRQAARNPDWLNHVAASKWTITEEREYRARKLGKRGAASEVRILMKDGVPAPLNGHSEAAET